MSAVYAAGLVGQGLDVIRLGPRALSGARL